MPITRLCASRTSSSRKRKSSACMTGDAIKYKRIASEPDWSRSRVNNTGEFGYLFGYQIHHMFTRYLFWNFVGRASDTQDSPPAWFTKTTQGDVLNYNSGYAPLFPIRFFALPLIFGLIGLVYQFRRDPKMASVYLLMFLMMGVIAAVQQNQQNPQPRERDYFYTGAFMVFAMWTGLGAFALLDKLRKENRISVGAATGVIAAALALVPLNMAVGGWKLHSRAGNFLPFDYSYNILQSVEKDAILFTNGDNDTFPLWYLQDVAGVRRDVRVVNLSLGGTTWYVDQLKNQTPHGALKVPLTFSDESLRVPEDDPMSINRPMRSIAQDISIPVSPEVMQKFGGSGPGVMTYPYSGLPIDKDPSGKPVYYYRLPHKLVNDILVQTKFERPVYFSTTVGQPGTPGEQDVFAGTDDFLRLEGMAYRVCPVIQRTQGGEAINSEIMEKNLINTIADNEVHTEPHYGFKLRNLNNPGVYYDEVHRRLMDNYRLLYLRYAQHLLQNEKNNAKAVAALDKMNATISLEQFPISYGLLYNIADFYRLAGAMPQAKQYAQKAIESAKRLIDRPEFMDADRYSRSFSPYAAAASSYEILGDYKQSRSMLERLANENGSDPSAQARIDEMEISMYEKNGNLKGALDAAERVAAKYRNSNQELYRSMLPNIETKIVQLKAQLGLRDSIAAKPRDTSINTK
ncbi:MAG: tetratricopeptide repeat protein [Bacteroidota bacterium]